MMEKCEGIYLWGAGRMEPVIRDLVLPGVAIKGIVDVQAEKLREKDGLPVLPPEAAKDFDAMVVTVLHPDDIRRQYLALGYPEEKLVLPWQGVAHDCPYLDLGKWARLLAGTEAERQRWRAANAPYEAGVAFPVIHPAAELLREVIRRRLSICRFGDGEFEIMHGRNRDWYQSSSAMLTTRLRAVVQERSPRLCVCLADNFGSLAQYTEAAADDIRAYMTQPGVRQEIIDVLSRDVTYYDAYVTRPYLIYRDKRHAREIFALWKQVFAGRNLLLVEGVHARSGEGNDLFDGCASLSRILTPDAEAFSQYEEILARVQSRAAQDTLILLRLGPAATVMARDLALAGYQAIDIGQLDNEYDWYRLGVTARVPIPGKLTAEARGSV